MKISYDPKFNIAYIHLREKPDEVETIHISDELNIDISQDGKVCGIELLNANEQLDIIKNKQIIFLNEQNNKMLSFPISI